MRAQLVYQLTRWHRYVCWGVESESGEWFCLRTQRLVGYVKADGVWATPFFILLALRVPTGRSLKTKEHWLLLWRFGFSRAQFNRLCRWCSHWRSGLKK